jgi:predicted dehydrogenase
LNAGLPVLIEKPLTATLDEALELQALVLTKGLLLGVAYTYSGYPLVREARARIAAGEIGNIRKVVVEYPQGWLAGDASGKQAEWRVDPSKAGLGGCIADIGVHAFHLAEFITGQRVTRLLADLGSVVPGRQLDDDCSILLRFDNGARGVLLASQIETGELNGLRIRVYGDKGGLNWKQEEPNALTITASDGTSRCLRAGTAVLGIDAASRTRTPGGHPEGYLEAFANLYCDFAALLRGDPAPLLPDIGEGVRGMTFIHTAVTASRDDAGWVDLNL